MMMRLLLIWMLGTAGLLADRARTQVELLGTLDLGDLLDDPLHATISPDGEDLAVTGAFDILSATFYKRSIELFR